MPCYLFTFHAYRSWMPDHKRGFTRRNEGVVPPSKKLAAAYEREATAEPVSFAEHLQQLLIEEVQISTGFQEFRVHFIATDSTHVHLLLSWRDLRPWLTVRTNIKSSLTKRLNREVSRRPWLAEHGSRKQVRDQNHFNYLVSKYLRKHTGWKWSEQEGLFK